MSLKLEYDEAIETNGIKVPFVPRIITPKIERPMRNSRYERGECAALREMLRKGDRVLELGAGVGLISTVAAMFEGIGSVTTVEANPELIPLIEETHRLNDVSPVDLRNDAGPVVWLNGSGQPLASLHEDPAQNGVDVRGSYDLVSLARYALSSLNSYMVKIFRGDGVVKDKMVSQRYWCQRDRLSDLTSTFERQMRAFQHSYNTLMNDEKLRQIHGDYCLAHEARIAELLTDPVLQKCRKWIFENSWHTQSDPAEVPA